MRKVGVLGIGQTSISANWDFSLRDLAANPVHKPCARLQNPISELIIFMSA